MVELESNADFYAADKKEPIIKAVLLYYGLTASQRRNKLGHNIRMPSDWNCWENFWWNEKKEMKLCLPANIFCNLILNK